MSEYGLSDRFESGESGTETETEPVAVTPGSPVRRRRPGRVLVLGVAVALVAASAGGGLYFSSRAGATTSSTSVTNTTAQSGDSVGPGDSVGTPGVTMRDGRLGGPPGVESGGFPGTNDGSTSGVTSAALDTTAATAGQGVGVVLINTVLAYEGAQAAGTGIILREDGEILTNNHVIDGATSITVTVVTTGESYAATVAGTDATADIAVLRLHGVSGLATASVDASSTVTIGDAVTGVGNAGGTGTLTAASGTVTGLDQTITTQSEAGSGAETLAGLIQVDADIESGDSGGPLYDDDGEVIGIDTAASTGSAAVTGYAIGIRDALSVVDDIESGTESDTITIGNPAFLGVAVSSSAVVLGVADGTPADGAGIVVGDTVTAIDGTAVTSAPDLTSVLAGRDPGASVTVAWRDASGATREATVTLVAGPAD